MTAGSGNVTMTNEQLKELIGAARDSGPTSDPLSKLKGPADLLGKALGGLYEFVQGGEKVFQNLSNTGNAFNNDIVGMRIAAANSRMSFEEFAAVQSKSAKDFAGLGGSVAKGGMAFTEFSKTFFDSGLTENLRQMGYTSKDLNEVLATQIGFQKSTTDTSVAGQIRTSQAAAELATEMDLIAKQTGKTRKEQEASLEKAKADGQIEAKMRLIGLQQGAEAEKTAREGFAKQLAQAEAMGTGQVFKEMFATGTVRSQEAAMQMGLLGDAARGTAESAKALSKGNIEASQASMETAKIGNMKNQKDEALLNITASGVGPAAEIMKKNIESNDAAYHGAVKTAQAMGTAMSDVTKVLGGQRKAIEDEQQARHGATAALISTTNRIADLKAAGANAIVRPLNTGNINQAGLDIYGKTSQGVGAKDTVAQTTKEYTQAAINNARQGGPAAAGTRENFEYGFNAAGGKTAVQAVDKVAGGAVQGITKGVEKVANFVADVINVKEFNAKLQTRDEGTLGKTGQPFEPADFIGKVAKGEMVLTPDQAQKFMSGAKMDGMANAVQEMAKTMPKLDIASMSKNIKIDTSAMPKPEDMIGMVKNLIPSGMSGMPGMPSGMPGSGTGKTLPGGFDPNIDDGGKAHRPGEREYAQQFAAQGNLANAEKLKADFDRALGRTSASSTPGAAPKMPAGASAAFDRTGFKMPSFDQISIGADGMPKITAKPQAQTVPTAVDKKTASQQNADAKQGVAAGKPEGKPAATTPAPTPTRQKVATLDDVAKLLSSLNTTMSKVSESAMETNRLVANQVRATKAMSGNVHDKT
jgi:hypothetical protein